MAKYVSIIIVRFQPVDNKAAMFIVAHLDMTDASGCTVRFLQIDRLLSERKKKALMKEALKNDTGNLLFLPKVKFRRDSKLIGVLTGTDRPFSETKRPQSFLGKIKGMLMGRKL